MILNLNVYLYNLCLSAKSMTCFLHFDITHSLALFNTYVHMT